MNDNVERQVCVIWRRICGSDLKIGKTVLNCPSCTPYSEAVLCSSRELLALLRSWPMTDDKVFTKPG